LVVNKEYSKFNDFRSNGRHINNTIEAEFVHNVKTRNQKYLAQEKSILDNINESITSVNTSKRINKQTDFKTVTYRIPEHIVKLYKSIEETLVVWFPIANKRYLEKKTVVFTSDRNFIMLSIRKNYITIKLLEILACSDPKSRFNNTSKINDAPYSMKYNISSFEEFLYCKDAIKDSYNMSIKKLT